MDDIKKEYENEIPHVLKAFSSSSYDVDVAVEFVENNVKSKTPCMRNGNHN